MRRFLSLPVTTVIGGVLALSLLGVAEGLTVTPDVIPPSGVRSSNTAATNSQIRYNLNTGAAFNISCSSTHTSDDFTVFFYKNGVVISNGDLEDTTLTETDPSTTQKFIQLEFLNFQPVHDGVYHCFASASDTNEELSSDLYLYGSEFPPPLPVRVTPRYVVLNTSADLVLEARFRGNFYSHEWVYNENDPTFLSISPSLFTPATRTNVGQTYTIPGSASLKVGYYGPAVLPTLTGTLVRPTPENTVIVGSFVAVTAFINGLTTAQVTAAAGDDVTFTCLARGFPETTITIQLSGVNASYTIGNQTLMTEATPTSSMEVNRTVTLHSVTVLDRGAVVMCEGSNMNSDGSTHTDQAAATLLVQGAPSVTFISAKQVVTSPAPVSLSCTVDSYPPSTITWLHHGAEVQAAPPRVTISTVQVDNRTQESTLTLLNTTSEDIGTYTCSAVNDEGSSNLTTELQVLEPPEVDVTEETFVVNETNPATLTCVATGIPQPNITWSVAPSFFTPVGGGGSMMVPVDSDGIDYTISSITRVLGSQNIEVTSTLTVLNTDMNDSGVYTCEATNSLGSVNDMAELIVQFAPEVINISQNQLTVSPDPVVMFCEATGYPRPTIAWFFNGALVTVNENVTIDTVVSPLKSTTLGLGRVTSYLRLSVTRPSDAGVYECVSSNLLGRATDRTNLTVHFRAEIDVSTFQDLYVVNEGQNVTFSCSAFGVPAPTISWRRDGMEFSPSSDTRVDLHSEETTQVDYMGPVYRTTRMLTFTTVTDSDTRNINGMMYQCVAVNSVGDSGSAEETQDVEDFTLFVQVAPTFTQDVVPTNVTFPADLTLTCTATARPRPNITWYKDGAELMEGGQVSITSKEEGERVLESTLTVTSPFLDRIGRYTCTAENVVDTANSTAEVTVYSQPFIRGPPVDLTVNQSRQATFSCTVQGNPVPTISWTGPSANFTTEVTPEANFTVLSVLTIDPAVRAFHEGPYTCSASNGVGPSPSSSAALTVQVPPSVQAVQGRIVGIQNMSVTLNFTISDASPEVQTENIQWTFRDLNGNSFNISTNLLITTFSNLMGVFSSDRLSLTLSGLTNDFEGTYTMTATNEAGSDSATVELVIEGPPRMIIPPMSQQVVNDVDVTFDCYALAEPVHSLTWYFVSAKGSNTTIGSVSGTEDMTTDSGKYQITNYTGRADYGRLLVRAVQFEDRGTYMCLAGNRHGADTESATLSVQVPPMFLSTSPQVDVIINSTDPVVLNCSLRGYPLSALRWRKDGTPLDPDSSHITITTFRRQDPTDPYPFSSTADSSFEPIPLEGLEYFEAVSELTLAPPLLRTDTANYTCEVEAVFVTNFTVASHDIPVIILEVPDAPFNVTITNNSQRSQVLSWVAPFDGNRPITQYVIYVSSSRQPNLTQIHPPLGGGRTRRQTTGDSTDPVPSVTVTNDPTTVIVSDLIPFVEYSYTVEAVNKLGRSDMSQPSPFVQTEAATPDSPPRGCEAMVVSPTSFGVMWSSPDPPNGDIANYTIVYRPVEAVADYDPSTLEGSTTKYTDANSTMFEAVGLQSAVLYSILLAATNQVGTSPFSQDLECTVLTEDDVPGVPQSVSVISPSSTSLLVSWDHPLLPDRNGVITGYTVHRRAGNEMNTAELFSNDTSQLLAGLVPFTEYNITVAGNTSAGQGEFSVPYTVRTLNDTASPPLCPTLTDVTTDSLDVSWYPPNIPRGDVTDYEISLSGARRYEPSFIDSRTERMSALSCGACSSPPPSCPESSAQPNECIRCTVPGLSAATNYTVTVAALSGAGTGASSDEVTKQTEARASTVTLQLHLQPVSKCTDWVDSDPEAKLSDIWAGLSDSIRQDCSCSLSVQQSLFSCLGTENSETVVYIAELSYTVIPGVVDVPSLLTSWVDSGPAITVNFNQLQVDTTCPVVIDSLEPQSCSITPADPPTDVTVIAVVTCIILLLVVVTIVAAVVVAVAVFRRKQSKYKPKCPLPNPVYEYEYMGSGSGGVALTNMMKNPAYVTAREAVTGFSSSPEEDKEKDHTYEVLPFEANEEMVQGDTTHGGQGEAADDVHVYVN